MSGVVYLARESEVDGLLSTGWVDTDERKYGFCVMAWTGDGEPVMPSQLQKQIDRCKQRRISWQGRMVRLRRAPATIAH